MRYLTIILIAIASCTFAYGQTYEIGPYIGGANFIGDVGSSNYINPNTIVAGGIFKWNRSPRHAWRLSILAGQLSGDDQKSHETRRQERGYSFDNQILEVSAGLEYNFWDFNMYESWQRPATPYLYTGFTYLNHRDFALSPRAGMLEDVGSSWDIAIPMVVGFKAAISRHLILAAELGARYTFTDAIDGNFPGDEDFGFATFGNINNNDWYMVAGVTLTYTFGRLPCYCGF